ncbi:GTP-binding protein [Streptomyces sp. SID5785]|uniref:CobW family GTP-binding protein n=1 Tax=Streptomyces sp. SID5785 TaxID=2690309 RepID=UPI001F26FCB6|nr:GTP-binding protein [Streptomyces sp. SID5785]
MSKASPQQIPVVVLAGFLGSGKTTLLNHLLHHGGGTRIGAIVNDFGSIEIDAMAVAGQLGDSTVSLGNGCLCCAVDASELDVYLDKLTRPVHDVHAIDVIVIEASGIAEPQELVRMVLASDNPRVVYGGLVEVVDTAEFDATREKHPEVERHLGLADLVVVNKADRVTDAERTRVLDAVRAAAERAAVVTASYARIDPELLFDCRPTEERIGQLSFDDLHRHDGNRSDDGNPSESQEPDGGRGHEEHLHAAYESVAFTSDVAMDPRRLMAFLDGRPDGLYRIKGYVDFGTGDTLNRYAVHAVGRFLRFYPEPWPAGERLTQLVLIGAGIDAEALHKELGACRSDEAAGTPTDVTDATHTRDVPHASQGERSHVPSIADERAMWGVLRYVQDKGDEAPDAPEAAHMPSGT